tara:strand:+ start:733 stop:1215 length:483 start_codon:yes stop_codon:yes gene_type:complete
MNKKSQKTKHNTNEIAKNKKARFNYEISETYEAGLVLEGWEVKSLREKKVNIIDTYIIIQKNEAWLVGANISPLKTTFLHNNSVPMRARKLLLNRRELNTLIGLIDRKGFTLVPILMFWKKGKAKLLFGLGKGKKLYDKRADQKERDWQRDKERMFRKNN